MIDMKNKALISRMINCSRARSWGARASRPLFSRQTSADLGPRARETPDAPGNVRKRPVRDHDRLPWEAYFSWIIQAEIPLAAKNVLEAMAERVGFEPTWPLLAAKTLSRRPRYDHFGTSPSRVVHRRKSKVGKTERFHELSGNSRRDDARLFPFLLKELPYDRGAAGSKDSARHLDPMVQFAVVQDPERAPARAGFRVASTVNQTLDAGLNHGAHAHRARLDCNIKRTAEQAVITELPRGPAQGEDFRVGRRVDEVKGAIMSTRDDAPLAHHHRAHRNLVLTRGPTGLDERSAQVLLRLALQLHGDPPPETGLRPHVTILARPDGRRRQQPHPRIRLLRTEIRCMTVRAGGTRIMTWSITRGDHQ